MRHTCGSSKPLASPAGPRAIQRASTATPPTANGSIRLRPIADQRQLPRTTSLPSSHHGVIPFNRLVPDRDDYPRIVAAIAARLVNSNRVGAERIAHARLVVIKGTPAARKPHWATIRTKPWTHAMPPRMGACLRRGDKRPGAGRVGGQLANPGAAGKPRPTGGSPPGAAPPPGRSPAPAAGRCSPVRCRGDRAHARLTGPSDSRRASSRHRRFSAQNGRHHRDISG